MKIFLIRIGLSLIIAYIIGYGLIVLKNIWTKELDLQKTFPNPFGFIHFKKESVTQTQQALKERAKELSKEILEFLADRERSAPRLPQKETWNIDTELMLRHLKETMNQYSIKFASRVITIRNEFSSLGLIDEELDKFYEHPTNFIGIRIIGERLGALAEQLK